MTPPKKGRSAASDATPKTLSSEKNVPASGTPGKRVRSVIDSRNGVLLTKVFEGRLTQYEVEQGSKRWRYGLLFQAQGKFERLIKEGRRLS
jgi:hypothetical protein